MMSGKKRKITGLSHDHELVTRDVKKEHRRIYIAAIILSLAMVRVVKTPFVVSIPAAVSVAVLCSI